jgi:hypothetical protein
MTGKRTSVYLAAAAAKSGLPLAELVRRGLYGPPVTPNVVPMRPASGSPQRGVPQSPASLSPSGDAGAKADSPTRRSVLHQAGPASPDPVVPTWRCGTCHHLQAIGSVENCEDCGASRNQAVPR